MITGVLVLSLSGLLASTNDLLRTRELFYKASGSKHDAEVFKAFLASSPDVDRAILLAYQGMYYMIKANLSWNPYEKLSFFNKGKNMLEEAIARNPANMELRFLRFCVQSNAPVFLGYSSKLDEDKNSILQAYSSSKDIDLKKRIKTFITENTASSDNEKILLK